MHGPYQTSHCQNLAFALSKIENHCRILSRGKIVVRIVFVRVAGEVIKGRGKCSGGDIGQTLDMIYFEVRKFAVALDVRERGNKNNSKVFGWNVRKNAVAVP